MSQGKAEGNVMQILEHMQPGLKDPNVGYRVQPRLNYTDQRQSLADKSPIALNRSSDIWLGDQAWSSSNQHLSLAVAGQSTPSITAVNPADIARQASTDQIPSNFRQAPTTHQPQFNQPSQESAVQQRNVAYGTQATSGANSVQRQRSRQSNYQGAHGSAESNFETAKRSHGVQPIIGSGLISQQALSRMQDDKNQYHYAQDLQLLGKTQKLNVPLQNKRNSTQSRTSKQSGQKTGSLRSQKQEVEQRSGVPSLRAERQPSVKNINIAQIIDDGLQLDNRLPVLQPLDAAPKKDRASISSISVNIAKIYSNNEATRVGQEKNQNSQNNTGTGKNSTKQLSQGKQSNHHDQYENKQQQSSEVNAQNKSMNHGVTLRSPESDIVDQVVKLPVSNENSQDYFEEAFKGLDQAEKEEEKKELSETDQQFKALELKTGTLDQLDFQSSSANQQFGQKVSESRKSIPLKQYSTNTKRSIENTLKKRASQQQLLRHDQNNTQLKQLIVNSDTTRQVKDSRSFLELQEASQQNMLKSSNNSQDEQILEVFARRYSGGNNDLVKRESKIQKQGQAQNGQDREQNQVKDGDAAASQVYNDSIFNEGEQFDEMNLTTAKNNKYESNQASTDVPTRNYNASNRLSQLHSKKYSSIMLSEEKDYGTEMNVNLEKVVTFNTKSGSNLPQIPQPKYFKPEEMIQPQRRNLGAPSSSVLSQMYLQGQSPPIQHRLVKSKNKNVNSMQNLLQRHEIDGVSQFSLQQQYIDDTLQRSWTNTKRLPDPDSLASMAGANELRELAKDRKLALQSYVDLKTSQEREVQNIVRKQSQLSLALQDLSQKMSQKKGKKFFSRGNYISSISQQTLPQIEKAKKQKSPTHASFSFQRSRQQASQLQSSYSQYQLARMEQEQLREESADLPHERATQLKKYYKSINRFQDGDRRVGRSLLETQHDKTSVMSDRSRLLRSLVTKKKSYVPVEKDYTELNKGKESLQSQFMRNSVTHPYKIHPRIQEEISKKTLLELWMDMLNQGKDPRGLLEESDVPESSLPSQIKIMKLLMEDEKHIGKRFEGYDKNDLQAVERLVTSWRSKMLIQKIIEQEQKLEGGDQTPHLKVVDTETQISQESAFDQKSGPISISVGSVPKKRRQKNENQKQTQEPVDPEILIIDKMYSQIPSLTPLKLTSAAEQEKSAATRPWMEDRSRSSLQDLTKTMSQESYDSKQKQSKVSGALGPRGSAYQDSDAMDQQSRSLHSDIAKAGGTRSASTIGVHYKNIREKCRDARINFQNKLKGFEDRMVDRISQKSAVLVYAQFVNESMEENRIDKHGGLLKLKSMENNSSRDQASTNSQYATPKNKYNQTKRPLKLEDVIKLKEPVRLSEDNRIEQIAYLQQFHKQQTEHKDSVMKELLRSSSPKRRSTFWKRNSIISGKSGRSGRSGESPKSTMKKTVSTSQVGADARNSSNLKSPGLSTKSGLDRSLTIKQKGSSYLQKLKSGDGKEQQSSFDQELPEKQYQFKPRNASMEHSFFNVGKSDQSDIKFAVRFKSYLDVAGVPSEYYTDQKMPRHLPPKYETDPLKKLIENKDKYKIKVPEVDRNVDLINRLAQLTTLQQHRRNAEKSQESSNTALDLICESHHPDNTIGLIQTIREETEKQWLKDKHNNPRYKKNFLSLRKGKESLHKLNNGPFNNRNLQKPYSKEAKDKITGEYKYIVPQ